MGGDGTKIALTEDIFDQLPGGVSSTRGKLADHVGIQVVLSPEGAVLVTSTGTKSSYPRPPQSLNNSIAQEIDHFDGNTLSHVKREEALAEFIVCNVSYDTIAFSFEIACNAELKRYLKKLTMKRCSDPTYKLVFPQLIRKLRKLLEKCFRGDVKYIPFTLVN